MQFEMNEIKVKIEKPIDITRPAGMIMPTPIPDPYPPIKPIGGLWSGDL